MRFTGLLLLCAFGLSVMAEGPASQPVGDQIESMRREIAELKRENARLAEELAKTRGVLAGAVESRPVEVKKNWKEQLRVGMTEAEANELFKRIPKVHGATMSQVTRSGSGGDRVVNWMQDPVDHGAGGIGSHAAISQAPLTRSSRLCTITFQSGVVTAIEY